MTRMNLMAPEVRADLYSAYTELRKGPPCQVEPMGLWAISRYDDVIAVLKSPERFSSAGHARVFRPPWLERSPFADCLAMVDPPAHTKLRNLVNRAFTPAAMSRLEERARDYSEEFAEAVVSRGEVDFAAQFAQPLPAIILGELMGLPPEVRNRPARWAMDVGRIPGEHTAEDMAQIRQSMAEMESHFSELIAAHRKNPGDDMLSELIRAEVEGVPLTDYEIVTFLVALLVAGLESSTAILSNTLLVLSKHPQERARVLADRSLIPKLVEEMLRYDSPTQAVFRLTTTATEVGGVTLPEGAMVLVLLASANRDEKSFPEADRFILDRDRQGNLPFGHGPHYCLGAALARMETRLAFEALFSRIRDFSILPGDLRWNSVLMGRGLLNLPVRFEPA